MAVAFTASASSLGCGNRAGTAIFSPSRSIPWCRNEAAPGHVAAGGLYTHRVDDRSGNFSYCLWCGVHVAELFATAGKDGIPSADLLPGSQARAGPDRT